MAQPKKVKDAAKQAEREHKEIYNPDAQTPPEGDTPPPEEQNPAAAAPAEPTDPAEPVEGTPEWEQKYKTLDGKYKAEVPRLNEEKDTLAVQNEGLQEQVNNLQHLLAALNNDVAAEVEATPAAKLLKSEEVEEYGEELIDVVKRAAREEFEPAVDKLRAENDRLKESLSTMTSNMVTSSKQGVYKQLDAAISNWREINKSPQFVDWLGKPDVYSGLTRQELLSRAFESGDAARVIAFFRGYGTEQTVVTTGTQGGEQRDPLDTLVAPGRPSATGAAGATQNTGHLWTQQQISQFYHMVNQGEFKDREQDRLDTERDIIAAAAEGRIR